jgi:hypothetical protein
MVNSLIRKNVRLASITCAGVKQSLMLTLLVESTKLLLKKNRRRQMRGKHLTRLMMLFFPGGLQNYAKQ